MCILSDMDLYYRSTFLGLLNDDGTVSPFRVERTHYQSRITNDRNFDSDDMSDYLHRNHDEISSHLCFEGSIYHYGSGDVSEAVINMDDPRLIMEIPDLGYFKNNRGRWMWLCYRPCHSAKKGLISDRVNLLYTLNISQNIRGIFNIRPTTESPHPDFLLDGNVLMYKGVLTGRLARPGVFQVPQNMSYLTSKLESLFPNITFEMGA